MTNNNMLFLTYDGDNAGRLVGRAVLADDVEGLHEVSNRINTGHEIVKQWVEDHGGQVISGGGDEGSFIVPAQALEDVERLRYDYQYATQLTMTVGVGKSLSEAGKSLMVGKFRGKDQVVVYDETVEPDLMAAKEHMEQGTATQEEKKIGEAYLKNENGADMADKTDIANQGELQGNQEVMQQSEMHDCQYCREAEAKNAPVDEAHCQYCHDMEQPEEAHCQYCAEADAKAAEHEHTGDDCQYCAEADAAAEQHEHTGDDCQYCAEAEAQDPAGVEQTGAPNVQNPTTQTSQDYAGQDLNAPGIDKPNPDEQMPIGQGNSMEAPVTNNNEALEVGGQGPTNTSPQDQATVSDITAVLDDEPNSNPVMDVIAQLDAEDLAVGHTMEDGVSRPANYDENVPSDMGLAEDEQVMDSPDLTEVLQGGLDSHADNIQREKVVQMVAVALEGFKNSKNILEKAKDQAPDLYNSTLAMLKAMIEMAKMMGLNGEQEQPTEEAPEQAQEEVQEDQGQAPMNNFNFHQSPADGEAAAVDPKAQRQ